MLSPRRAKCNLLALIAFMLLTFLQPVTTYLVKNSDGKGCMIANFSGFLTIKYPKGSQSSADATIDLDDAVLGPLSKCRKLISLEVKNGEKQHNFTMEFSVIDNIAQLETISFSYTLDDEKIFPGADKSGGPDKTATITVFKQLSPASTFFQCSMLEFTLDVQDNSSERVVVSLNTVKIQLTNLESDGYTGNGKLCDRNVAKELIVKDEKNSTCLLMKIATFKVSTKCDGKESVISIDVGDASVDGSCWNNAGILKLNSKKKSGYSIEMGFGLDGDYYQLMSVTVNAAAETFDCSSPVAAHTSDFDAVIRAPHNSAYYCNAEQKINVDDNTTVVLSGVELVAFHRPGSSEKDFACLQDYSDSKLIPALVGCGFAGIIILHVIAYMIGRWRYKYKAVKLIKASHVNA